MNRSYYQKHRLPIFDQYIKKLVGSKKPWCFLRIKFPGIFFKYMKSPLEVKLEIPPPIKVT